MKKKLASLAFALSLLLLGASPAPSFPLEAEGMSLSGVKLKAEYSLGSHINIPSGAAIVDEAGESHPIDSASLSYPDGSLRAGRSFSLDSYGQYTLFLQAGSLSEKKALKVLPAYFYTEQGKSKVSYGPLNASFRNGGYANGLKIDSAEGDAFLSSEPIDLYAEKEVPLIGWNVLQYEPIVHYVSVRLVDAYDPSVYVDIVEKKGDYVYETYIGAGYCGLRANGLEKDDSGAVEVGGEHYSLSSFGGTRIPGNSDISGAYNNAHYSIDCSDRKHPKIYVTTDAEVQRSLVAELGNPAMYGAEFPGFTNGLAYLSIKVESFDGVETAPLEIAYWGKRAGRDLLPTDYYRDENAPIFALDVPAGQSQIAVGAPLHLPSYSAMDDSGLRGEPSAYVYYAYDDPATRESIPLEEGTFTPKKKGIYSLILEAVDVYGNRGSKRLDLYASKEAEEGILFSLDSPVLGAQAGEYVKLDGYRLSYLNEEPTVRLKVTSPSGEVTEQSPEDPYFLLEAGEYQLHYEYRDSFYQGSYDASFQAAPSKEPVFAKAYLPAPSAYLSGFSYSVEPVEAASYDASGKKAESAEAYLAYDGGSFEKIDPSSFLVEKGRSSLQLKWKAKDSEILSPVTPILNPKNEDGTLALANYFFGGASASFSKDGNALEFRGSGSAEASFANPLLYSAFSLSFSASSIPAFDLILASYDDPSVSLTVSFLSGNQVKANGKSYSFAWGEKRIDVSFLSGSGLSLGSLLLPVADFFPNERITLKFRFPSLSEASALSLYSIGNQVLRASAKRDSVAPMVALSPLPKFGRLGETVEAPSFYAADVLSPMSESRVTMNGRFLDSKGDLHFLKTTEGEELQSVSDVRKKRVVTLSDYGDYLFSYAVKDGAGVSLFGGISESISVRDDVKPTLRLLGDTSKPVSAKAGQEILPMKAEVSDNCSSAEKVTLSYLVYDSRGIFVTGVSSQTAAFSLAEKGLYTVHVVARDEAGNSAYASYQIRVS